MSARSLKSEDYAYYIKEAESALKADQQNRCRGIRNILAYTNIDDSQVSNGLKSALEEEGRDPQTYNFIQMIVRGHVGNYLMNSVDPKFIDREGDDVNSNEMCAMAQRLWYANKSQYKYASVFRQMFENGLCYRGDAEIVIDRPSQNPREWGIKLSPLRFDLLVYDQSNLSDRISRNSKKAWKYSYISAKEAINIYKYKEAEILGKMISENDSVDYEKIDLQKFVNLYDIKRLNAKKQVIEYFHIEEEKQSRQFWINPTNGKFEQLPATDKPFDSDEDIALKTDIIYTKYGVVIDWNSVVNITDYQPCLYVTTLMPELGLVLEHKKDYRQLNGHLPFYSWSFIQKFGMSVGLVDVIYNAQNDVNLREMAKTKYLTQSPIFGKHWISQDIAMDSDKKLEEIVRDYADLSIPLITPSGAPGNMFAGQIAGTSANMSLIQDINEKIEIMEKTGSTPPVMQGRSSNSAESGIAVGRRAVEANAMNRMEIETFVECLHEIYEDWLIMAPKVFGGRHNTNRTFNGADNSPITINIFGGYDESGNEITINNISNLERIQVIITETKENDYMKQTQREMDVGVLNVLQPTPQNEGIRAVYETSLASKMDYTDENEKELVSKACKDRLEIANLQSELLIKNLRAQLAAPPPGEGVQTLGNNNPAAPAMASA